MYCRSARTFKLVGAEAAVSGVDSAELAVTGNTETDPVIRVPVKAIRRRCAATANVLRLMSLTAQFRNHATIRPVCGAV